MLLVRLQAMVPLRRTSRISEPGPGYGKSLMPRHPQRSKQVLVLVESMTELGIQRGHAERHIYEFACGHRNIKPYRIDHHIDFFLIARGFEIKRKFWVFPALNKISLKRPVGLYDK